MKYNYDKKTFRSVNNTSNGEVDSSTLFYYTQHENIVTATYTGKNIICGQLLAKVNVDGSLSMRYHHLNHAGEFKNGHCLSTPEIMQNGKIRLHEKWQWDCDDYSEGESIIEEI